MKTEVATISYLPNDISEEIAKLQKEFSKRFNTIRAQDWKPHVTIAFKVDNYRR